MNVSRTAASAVAVIASIVLLSGCQPALPVAGDTGAGVVATGSNGQVVDPSAPVLIAPDDAVATAAVGAFISFDLPADDVLTTVITTDAPDIVEIFPASSGGGMLTPPSAVGLAPGTANITIKDPTGTQHTVVLTVTG